MNTEQLFDMWMEYNFGQTDSNWEWTPTNGRWLGVGVEPLFPDWKKQVREFDFMLEFLKAKVQVSADLWAKLDMKL